MVVEGNKDIGTELENQRDRQDSEKHRVRETDRKKVRKAKSEID